jgi:hypothetical protein
MEDGFGMRMRMPMIFHLVSKAKLSGSVCPGFTKLNMRTKRLTSLLRGENGRLSLANLAIRFNQPAGRFRNEIREIKSKLSVWSWPDDGGPRIPAILNPFALIHFRDMEYAISGPAKSEMRAGDKIAGPLQK